jgi:NADH:ubiquinone oxidoreductase subunit H
LVQAIVPVFWFVAKVFCFLFLYIWVRGTLPRFRYDQLMGFGWKFLMPLAIANILATSLAGSPYSQPRFSHGGGVLQSASGPKASTQR